MSKFRSLLETVKPAIPKRYLPFVAGVVWTFAGGVLLYRGLFTALQYPDWLWMRMLVCMAAGLVFYYFLFSRISLMHLMRILTIKEDKPCLFSFFNVKSYLMMGIMIAGGIMLRYTGLVPAEYLSGFYVTMATPLLISAARFYYNGLIHL